MSDFSFDELARQSPKGIVINYGVLLYRLVKSFWVLIPIFLSKNIENKIGFVLTAIGILGGVLLIVAILQYLNFKFKIKEAHFVLHQGVIFKKKTSIPLERIQSVNFKQNLIHQLINITQVEIQTAGAKDVEVSIKAISREKAEALKKRLQNGIRMEFSEEEDIESTESKTRMIYKLSFIELVKVSFSENHLRSFFWILAISFSFGFQLEDVIKDLDFASESIRFVARNRDVLAGSVVLLIVVFFVAVIISVIVSFVRVLLRNFDQKVTQLNDGIQVSQGLFTKREDVLKITKIQYTVTVTNPFKKYLGIRSILISQAGSAKVKQKKRIELVGVKRKETDRLNELFFNDVNLENDYQFKPAKYYLFRMFVRTSILLILLNVLLVLTQSHWINIVVLNGIFLPSSIWLVLLKYKKTYFNLSGDKLTVGDGKISTVTTLMEYFKTQNVTFSQSFIQKRKRVATLHIQTASGVVKLPCLKEEDAKLLKTLIIQETSNSNREWI